MSPNPPIRKPSPDSNTTVSAPMPKMSNKSGAVIALILSACVIGAAMKLGIRTLANLKAYSTVVVKSVPSGAVVFWNDEYVGETGANPVRIFDVTPGRYVLQVEKRGYVRYRKVVSIADRPTNILDLEFWRSCYKELASYLHDPRRLLEGPTKDELAYNVNLTPQKPGSVTIRSNPTGAKVYIEGKLKGKTPLENLQLIPGTYRFRIQKDDYTPWVGEVRIEPSKHTEVNRKLRATQFAFYKYEIAKDPDNLMNYVELAKGYFSKQEIGEAQRILSKAFDVASRHARRGRELGKFLKEVQRIYSGEINYGGEEMLQRVRSVVEAELEKLIANHPQVAIYYNFLARFYEISQQTNKLIALYKKAVKMLPQDTEMHLRLAEFYLDHDEPQKALDLVEKIKSKRTNKAMARYISAMANMKLGRKARARIDLKIASFYIGNRDIELKRKINVALRELKAER